MKYGKMTVQQGYKPSPLGLIPEDWEVKRLGDLCENKGDYGLNAPATDCSDDLPTYLRITDIDDSGNFIHSTKKSVDNLSAKEYYLKDGDIVFARTGATVGKTYLYNVRDGQLVYAGFLIKFSPNPNKLIPYYLKAHTETKDYMNWVAITSQRSGQPGINAAEYCSLKLAIPPIEEQERICNVLQLWDTAIAKQTALIENLTLRKRGLMQQLLTGKKRLKGFEGKWTKRTYSSILKEIKRSLVWDEDELYKLISVRRRSEGLFFRESLYGREIATKNLRPTKAGDFLISKMQIVHGASGLVTEDFDNAKISGSYIALVAKDDNILDIEYFNLWSQTPRFYHQTFISSFGVHIEKMTFDLDTFMSFGMPLPSINEQHAIVSIMGSITKEIEIQKQKLAAMQAQKKGLMQVLLTGKKRINK